MQIDPGSRYLSSEKNKGFLSPLLFKIIKRAVQHNTVYIIRKFNVFKIVFHTFKYKINIHYIKTKHNKKEQNKNPGRFCSFSF